MHFPNAPSLDLSSPSTSINATSSSSLTFNSTRKPRTMCLNQFQQNYEDTILCSNGDKSKQETSGSCDHTVVIHTKRQATKR